MTAGTDRWARWLGRDRHGGDPKALESALAMLAPIRDRVLAGAELSGSETLLDLGCGEGLIGFAALERLPRGRVIFSDVSTELIERCRRIAAELELAERCEFLVAEADRLPSVEDGSVDVVTARSVLIYLDRDAKRRALAEAARVLRPGGRLSIFEPINRFSFPESAGRLLGYDVTAIDDIAAKVRAAMEARADGSPLMDFDERDLFAWAEAAGFAAVELTLEARRTQEPPKIALDWKTLMKISGNPLDPPLGETIEDALSREEAAALEAHLRPLLAAPRWERSAHAYLRALK